MCNGHNTKRLQFLSLFPFPLQPYLVRIDIRSWTLRFGHVFNGSGLQQIGPKRIVVTPYFGRIHLSINQTFTGIAYRPIFCMTNLLQYNHCSDNQCDGNGKLHHHQNLSGKSSPLSSPKSSFQNRNRVETGEIKSRIASRNQAGKQGKHNDSKPENRFSPGHCRLFACHLVKPRQRKLNKSKSKEERNAGNHQRFSQKLPDKLIPYRTNRLPDAYFLRSFFTSGGTQVHKINTGQ